MAVKTLKVASFIPEVSGFKRIGREPILDSLDDDASYIKANEIKLDQYYTFEKIPRDVVINSVIIKLRARRGTSPFGRLDGYLWDGAAYVSVTGEAGFGLTKSYSTYPFGVTNILNTAEKVNNTRLTIKQLMPNSYYLPEARVTYAALEVDYTEVVPPPPPKRKCTWPCILAVLAFIGSNMAVAYWDEKRRKR